MLTRMMFGLLLVAILPGISSSGDPVSRKRVLLLGQKPDGHPPGTHEYLAGLRFIAKSLERVPDLQVVLAHADEPWEEGVELLDGCDAVVLSLAEGAKWICRKPDRLTAFQRLARQGAGLTCLHWAMGTKDPEPIPQFTALFGACHGGSDRKYQVLTTTAKPAGSQHPILAGIKPFQVHDEFYYALKKPAIATHRIQPLIEVEIEGSRHFVAWACERADGGRSFGFSGLHFHDNWKLAEYRRLVLQGILWSVKQTIPEAGLSVDVNPDDLRLPGLLIENR